MRSKYDNLLHLRRRYNVVDTFVNDDVITPVEYFSSISPVNNGK